MADDRITPPPLAPELADLLTTNERDVLHAICRDGDIVDGFAARLLNGAHGLPDDLDEGDGGAWLLVRLSPALLDALAAFEADAADLEAEPDAEDGGDDEPSLGSTHDVDQQKGWGRPHGPYDPEAEFDGDGVRCADAEPMLGAPENHPEIYGESPAGQLFWAQGRGDLEEEAVNEDGGAIDDEGHGDTLEETGAGCGNCDEEASLSATEDVDQVAAWAPSFGVEDGEASGTEDDIESSFPDAAWGAGAREAEEAWQALLRQSGGRPVCIGPELILLGPCHELGGPA